MPAVAEDLEPPGAEGAGELPEGALDQLAFRYGHAARNVLALAAERPELARPIVPGRPDLLAEAVIAAREEQARSVADVLLRRTRLGILAAPELRSAKSVLPVAEAMGTELGWSRRRVRHEAQAWLEVRAAEGIDPADPAAGGAGGLDP
jgi:glycerol-3-phosphate dehydrogenase